MGVLNIPYLQAGNSLTARCAHLQPQAWIMAVKYTPFPLVALNIINTNLSGTKVLTHKLEQYHPIEIFMPMIGST